MRAGKKEKMTQKATLGTNLQNITGNKLKKGQQINSCWQTERHMTGGAKHETENTIIRRKKEFVFQHKHNFNTINSLIH